MFAGFAVEASFSMNVWRCFCHKTLLSIRYVTEICVLMVLIQHLKQGNCINTGTDAGINTPSAAALPKKFRFLALLQQSAFFIALK